MEEKTVLEGNRLIAEFMGVKIGIDLYAWRIGAATVPLRDEHLAYHKEWGWLMPVVEKIEREHGKGVAIEGYGVIITSFSNEDPRKPPFRIATHKKTKIEAVWQAVVDFIQWYSSQSKQTLHT